MLRSADNILQLIGDDEIEDALRLIDHQIDYLYENQRKRGKEFKAGLKRVLGTLRSEEIYGCGHLSGEDPAAFSTPQGLDSSPQLLKVKEGFKTLERWTPIEDFEYTGSGGWIYRENFFTDKHSLVDGPFMNVRRRCMRRISVSKEQYDIAVHALELEKQTRANRRAFNLTYIKNAFSHKLNIPIKAQLFYENERADDDGVFSKDNLNVTTDPPEFSICELPLFRDSQDYDINMFCPQKVEGASIVSNLRKEHTRGNDLSLASDMSRASERSDISVDSPLSSPITREVKNQKKLKSSLVRHNAFSTNSATKQEMSANMKDLREEALSKDNFYGCQDGNQGEEHRRSDISYATSNHTPWEHASKAPSLATTRLPKGWVFFKGFNFCVDKKTDPFGWNYAADFPKSETLNEINGLHAINSFTLRKGVDGVVDISTAEGRKGEHNDEIVYEWKVRRRIWARLACPKTVAARAVQAFRIYSKRKPRGIILEQGMYKGKGSSDKHGFHARKMQLSDRFLEYYSGYRKRGELRLIACQTEALFESEKSYIRQPSISLYDWQESRKRYPTLVSIDNSGDEGPMFRYRQSSFNDILDTLTGGNGDVLSPNPKLKLMTNLDNSSNSNKSAKTTKSGKDDIRTYSLDGLEPTRMVKVDPKKESRTNDSKKQAGFKKFQIYICKTPLSKECEVLEKLEQGNLLDHSLWSNCNFCCTGDRDQILFGSSDRMEAEIWVQTLRHQVHLKSPNVFDVPGHPKQPLVSQTNLQAYKFKSRDTLELLNVFNDARKGVTSSIQLVGGRAASLVGTAASVTTSTLGLSRTPAHSTDEPMKVKLLTPEEEELRKFNENIQLVRQDLDFDPIKGEIKPPATDPLSRNGDLGQWKLEEKQAKKRNKQNKNVNVNSDFNDEGSEGNSAVLKMQRDLDRMGVQDGHEEIIEEDSDSDDDSNDDQIPSIYHVKGGRRTSRGGSTVSSLSTGFTAHTTGSTTISTAPALSNNNTRVPESASISRNNSNNFNPLLPKAITDNPALKAKADNLRSRLPPNIFVGLLAEKKFVNERSFKDRFIWISIFNDGGRYLNWSKGKEKPSNGDTFRGIRYIAGSKEANVKKDNNTTSDFKCIDLRYAKAPKITDKKKNEITIFADNEDGVVLRFSRINLAREWVTSISNIIKRARQEND